MYVGLKYGGDESCLVDCVHPWLALPLNRVEYDCTRIESTPIVLIPSEPLVYKLVVVHELVTESCVHYNEQ